mgnify:CR=1 FL=1
MPVELAGPGDPLEWLRRARSNLARAKADRDLADVVYEDLCFDAQQAVEKSLKAVLVHRGLGFPKTHDINVLLGLIARAGVGVPEELREADILTEYAVEARYPGLREPVARDEYERAVDLAEHNIRVNAIAPGPIDTPRIRAQHNEERHAAWLRAVPLARIGEPEEVAAVAAFLASDDASYVTGQTLAVDGGFSAAGLRVKNLEPRA